MAELSTLGAAIEAALAVTILPASSVSGLGTAAALNVGTGANQVVQLNASGQLPAVDGSLLTGISGGGGGTITASGPPVAAQVAVFSSATNLTGRSIGTGINTIAAGDHNHSGVYQIFSALLAAINGAGSGANLFPYYTAANTVALTELTADARTLLAGANLAAMRTSLVAQPLEAKLTSLSGLTGLADRLPYLSGVSTFALSTFTAFGRQLTAAVDANAAKTVLSIPASYISDLAGLSAALTSGAADTALLAAHKGLMTGQLDSDKTAILTSIIAPSIGSSAVFTTDIDGNPVGEPIVPLAVMTFADFAAGLQSAFVDAQGLAKIWFPTAVPIVSGVAQINWTGSDASLCRMITLDATNAAAEIRLQALSGETEYLKGQRITIEIFNQNGGAKTITRSATGAGNAVLAPPTFTIPAIGTGAGSRIIIKIRIAADGALIYEEAIGYASIAALPSYVGSTAYYNDTAATISSYQLAMPTGSQAGDMAIISVPQAAASNTALTYGTAIESLARLNSTPGSAYGTAVYKYALVQADVDAGYLVIPSVTQVTPVGVDVFRNAPTVTHANSYMRHAGLTNNSAVLRSETSTKDSSIALAIVVSGGGIRTPNALTGWTARISRTDPSATGAGRYNLRSFTRTLGATGAVSPADTYSVTGAADLQFTTMTVLMESA